MGLEDDDSDIVKERQKEKKEEKEKTHKSAELRLQKGKIRTFPYLVTEFPHRARFRMITHAVPGATHT